MRRVIWLRESNKKIVKLLQSGEAAVGDCSVKLQREADRSGPSMRKPTARPEAAARQTACDRLSLCVWVRAGAGRLWRKVKNVESLLSARKLREEADIPQE